MPITKHRKIAIVKTEGPNPQVIHRNGRKMYKCDRIRVEKNFFIPQYEVKNESVDQS